MKEIKIITGKESIFKLEDIKDTDLIGIECTSGKRIIIKKDFRYNVLDSHFCVCHDCWDKSKLEIVKGYILGYSNVSFYLFENEKEMLKWFAE